MLSSRFNILVQKAISNTAISTRYLSVAASKPSKSKKPKSKPKPKPKPKPKTLSKGDQKLLKQYTDPSKPKRPLTSYLRFARQYRITNKLTINPQTMGDVSFKIGSAWRNLSASSKSAFTAEYVKDRANYADAVQSYKGNNSQKTWLDKIKSALPTKPAPTGYTAFIKAEFNSNTSPGSMVQRAAIAVKKWNKLSDVEKQRRNDNAKAAYAMWKMKLYS